MEKKPLLRNFITVVSGLPRSGTSMMMQILKAGGMEVVTDEVRRADEDNPRGYFELEQVKKLKESSAWLADCRGKAVKVISMLLFDLPSNHHYKIIFMQRPTEEMLASQRIMLERRGETKDGISDEHMAEKFEKHLKQVEHWIAQQKNMEVLYVPYNEVIKNPLLYSEKVNGFLGQDFNTKTMAEAVEETFYRQRKE
ncbi:MAG: sulfotransferase domain-containing protein [Thermodesulfobacteriota bacterium]|jgi:hypothetical protein|nr:MAG: sulfotransferase domain-containing protein [Thermodesulfobacteriota bacterium]